VLLLGDCYQPILIAGKLIAAYEGASIVGVASIYRGFAKPDVVLSPTASTSVKRALLDAAMKEVTGEFITLCSRDELELFKEHATVLTAETEYQMIANPPKKPSGDGKAGRVCKDELAELDVFYRERHAEAWAPIQFEAGPFYCVKQDGRIVSAAGTHLAAPQIGHLGSVITDEAYRRRGYAAACTSRVAMDLSRGGKRLVSLFARTGNEPALSMYHKLGFKEQREICLVTLRKK
jgi:ribosomal protein S18 acetylase RimI-like enzyme